TPVRLALRTIVLSQIQNLLNRLLRDRRLTTATLANLAQPCHPILGEPCPPVRHRGRRHRQCLRNSRIGDTLRRHQQRLSPHHLTMRTRLRPCHRLQQLTLPRRNLQRCDRLPHGRDPIEPNTNYLRDTPLVPEARCWPRCERSTTAIRIDTRALTAVLACIGLVGGLKAIENIASESLYRKELR